MIDGFRLPAEPVNFVDTTLCLHTHTRSVSTTPQECAGVENRVPVNHAHGISHLRMRVCMSDRGESTHCTIMYNFTDILRKSVRMRQQCQKAASLSCSVSPPMAS